MRISFSGSANVGKSTLLYHFLRRWPMYGTPEKTYREVISNEKLEHSSNTNEVTQVSILNWMMEEQEKYPKGTKVAYDRCTWDNLAYTLHANSKDKISDDVTGVVIPLVKESMKNIDIVFWIPFNDQIKVVNDGLRDANIEYIKEVDAIFEDLYKQYSDDLEGDVFYPKEDCPAIIKVEGLTIDDRLNYIGEFLDHSGELIETESSILDPKNLDLLEQMIKDQNTQMLQDSQHRALLEQIQKLKDNDR